MRKAMSIQIEEELYAYVSRKVLEGEYETHANVIEAGLKLLREQSEELEAIRQALIEGEVSGEATEFDFDGFLKRMRERHGVELTSEVSDHEIAAVENTTMEGRLDDSDH